MLTKTVKLLDIIQHESFREDFQKRGFDDLLKNLHKYDPDAVIRASPDHFHDHAPLIISEKGRYKGVSLKLVDGDFEFTFPVENDHISYLCSGTYGVSFTIWPMCSKKNTFTVQSHYGRYFDDLIQVKPENVFLIYPVATQLSKLTALSNLPPPPEPTVEKKVDDLAGRLARGFGETNFIQNYYQDRNMKLEDKIDKLLALVKTHFPEESPPKTKTNQKLPAPVISSIVKDF